MDDSADRLTRLEPGSEFAGYRIEGMLDRGGMGVVYKAADADLDRTVALKIIAPEHTQNPDAVTRFKAEARLAASLEHPNIVPIHRGGEYHGVLYLAMRFVPGTNLRQVIDRGPLEHGPDPAGDHLGRRRARRRARARAGAPRRQAGQHPDQRRGRARARLPHRLRAHQAARIGRQPDPHRRLGRDPRLRRARADPGRHGRRARRHLLARLRALRDAHRQRRLPEGQRHGQAVGARHRPAARAEPQAPGPAQAFDEVVARATAKDPNERYSRASRAGRRGRSRQRRAELRSRCRTPSR